MDTFKRETSLRHILDAAADESKLFADDSFDSKRVDLALKSTEHLLVVELMRPGKTADYDHLTRCRAYVHSIRYRTEAETGLGITRVTGLIIADKLANNPIVQKELGELAKFEVYAYSWESLLTTSEKRWRDFLEIIGERAPQDERVQALKG